MKTYSFWAMVLFFVLYAVAFYAAYANVSLYMADLGWAPELYGTIFSFVNTANVIAMFVGGYATASLRLMSFTTSQALTPRCLKHCSLCS